MEPPVSVLFVDNTKDGRLAKRLQEEEKRLGGITSYRIRIAGGAVPCTRASAKCARWTWWTRSRRT